MFAVILGFSRSMLALKLSLPNSRFTLSLYQSEILSYIKEGKRRTNLGKKVRKIKGERRLKIYCLDFIRSLEADYLLSDL